MNVEKAPIDAFIERWATSEDRDIELIAQEIECMDIYFSKLCSYMDENKYSYKYQHMTSGLTINRFLYAFYVSTRYD